MAEYPMPSWLQAPDPSARLLEGFRAGSAISEANARLQSQANETAMQMQVHQQQMQQEQLRQQQQLQITQAYHQAQIGLRQQALQEAHQKNQVAIQQAAREAQGEGLVKQYIDQHQDMPVEQASLRGRMMYNEYFRNSSAGMGSMGSALQRMQAQVPPGVTAQQKQQGELQKVQANMYARMIEQGHKDMSAASTPETQSQAQASIAAGTRGLNNLRWGTQPGAAPAAPVGRGGAVAPPQSAPLPAKKSELVKGQVYQTARGIAAWDGTKFVRQ